MFQVRRHRRGGQGGRHHGPGLQSVAARSGQVLAPVGSFCRWCRSRLGERGPVARIAGPPSRHADALAEVAVTVMLTSMALTGLLLGIRAITNHFLHCRRFRSWDAEWRSIGPLWTGHRS